MPKVDFPEDYFTDRKKLDEEFVKDPIFGVPPYRKSFIETAKIIEEDAKAVAEYERMVRENKEALEKKLDGIKLNILESFTDVYHLECFLQEVKDAYIDKHYGRGGRSK